VSNTWNVKEAEEFEQKSKQFKCSNCDKVYKYEKALLNHLAAKHKEKTIQIAETPRIEPKNEKEVEDHVNNYSRSLLTYNLFLRTINDCTREGDGERLLECYKFSLLFFKCFGHAKYAYTLLKLLHRIRLEPRSAFELIWNRFIKYKRQERPEYIKRSSP